MKRVAFSILTAIVFLFVTVFNTGVVDASDHALRSFSTPADGAWNGTTSLAKTMSFTVSGGGTQWSSFALSTGFYASNCSASVTTTLTYPGPGSITNGSFSYMNGTATYSFYGQFDSPYTASGTYAFTNYKFDIFNGISHCYYYLTQSGTWSASIPPPAPGAFDKIAPADGATDQPVKPTLSWGSSSDASSYEYCYSTENPCTDWKTNNAATSVVLPVLAETTTYYWNVRAVNSTATVYANGSEANWSFTTGTLPGAFDMISPADGATNKPANQKLTWSASTGATAYYYCIDKTNDGKCNVWKDNGTAVTKTLSGLLPNTTYYWHVKAVNDVGATYSNGALAVIWSFKTGLKPAAFAKTAPANGALNQSIAPTLSWGASTGATYYQYCISKVNPCTKWVKLGKATSVALSGLLPKTKYYWQVRAVNSFGTVYANATTVNWSFTTK